MRTRAIITCTVLALLPALAALADLPSSEESEFLDEFAFLEQESSYVESASRRKQPVQLSPSAVYIITREEIEASGARTLPEVLRVVPNMDVHMLNPFWYYVGVRGGLSRMGSDSVMLMVNGRDATLEFFGFPTWTAQPFSLDEVKRIEVIRGPGSALYGANALSGVVSVTTYAPGEGPRASVSVRGGEHGALELGLRGTETFGPIAVAASAGLIQQDFWTERDLESLDVMRARLEGLFKLGEHSSLLAEGAFYHTYGRGRTGLGEVDFIDLYSGLARLRLELGDFLLQAVYERFAVDIDVNLDIEISDILLLWTPVAVVAVDRLGVTAQHSVEFAYNRIVYGAEYLLHSYNIDIFIPPELAEHRFGVFVQDELDIAAIIESIAAAKIPPLYLTAGLRFDYNSQLLWELSPRAALVFQPAEHHTLRVGYAHAFQKPKLLYTELRVRLEHVSYVGIEEIRFEPDSDLDNETIDSIEASYGIDLLGGDLQMKIDFAYNFYRDPVYLETRDDEMRYVQIGSLRIPDPSGPGLAVTNDRLLLHGYNLEFQIAGRPTENSRAFLNLGIRRLYDDRRGTIEDREPFLRMAAGLDLRSDEGWQLSLRGIFNDEIGHRVREPGGYFADITMLRLPPSLLVNARLARTVRAGLLSFQVGVEAYNLLGSRHRDWPGLEMPNRSDWISERQDRRVVLFLRGQIR